MKIILVGEFSGVHSELGKALKSSGESVLTVSDGDSYKKFNSDLLVIDKQRKGWIGWIYQVFYLTGFTGLINFWRLKRKLSGYRNFDVAQFINPVAIESLGALGNLFLFIYLKRKSKVVSLCALGDDFFWVKACLSGEYKYSPLDRIRSHGFRGIIKHRYSLKYVFSPMFVLLSIVIARKSNIVIPGLVDYKIAYKKLTNVADLIPLPLGSERFQIPRKTSYPVKIFHGWQRGKDTRKGNDILDNVAKSVVRLLGEDKVTYEVVSGVPFAEYVKSYSEADIFFDQLYSYDRGINGALGMAAGKVVFSGFEDAVDNIGVNAIPDDEYLQDTLIQLISSLSLLDSIKCNAYRYALDNYSSKYVAKRYIEVWSDFL